MISNKSSEPYLKDILLRMSGMFYAKFVGFIASIFTARILGPEEFGNVRIAMSLIVILSLFSGSFMRNALVTKVSQLDSAPQEQVNELGKVFSFVLIAGIITALVAFIIFYFFSPLSNKKSEYILLFSLPVLFLPALSQCLIGYFQGLGKLKLMTGLEIFRSTLNTLFLVVFVYLFAIHGWIFGRILGAVFSLMVIWIIFKQISKNMGKINKLSINLNVLKNKNLLWYYKWSLLGSGIAVFVKNIDSVIVAEFLQDPRQVGFLVIAILIYSGLAMYTQSISSATFNRVAKLAGKEKNLKSLLFRLKLITVPIYVIIAVGFYFFAESIVTNIFGDLYLDAVPLVKIFIISSVFLNYTQLNGGFWSATGNVKLISKYYTTISFIYITALVIFVQFYGLLGAAYATLLSTFLGLILSDILTRKHIATIPDEMQYNTAISSNENELIV